MHYSHPSYVRVAQIEEGRIARSGLVGKPDRKRTLGRSRCRWKESIKIYMKNSFDRVWTVPEC